MTDSEDDIEIPLPTSQNETLSSSALYSVADDEALKKGGQNSTRSIYDEGGAVFERRASIDSNFSVDSDMTGDSWKKLKRSSKRNRSSKSTNKNRSSKSTRKSNSSNRTDYANLDTEAANRMLVERDIVISSLVVQVEKLQRDLAEQNNNIESAVVGDERDLADELEQSKKTLHRKEKIAESLLEQMQIQNHLISDKTRVIDEQSREIARLKEQLASTGKDAEGNGNVVDSVKNTKDPSHSINNTTSSANDGEGGDPIVSPKSSPKLRPRPKVTTEGGKLERKKSERRKKRTNSLKKQSSSRKSRNVPAES